MPTPGLHVVLAAHLPGPPPSALHCSELGPTVYETKPTRMHLLPSLKKLEEGRIRGESLLGSEAPGWVASALCLEKLENRNLARGKGRVRGHEDEGPLCQICSEEQRTLPFLWFCIPLFFKAY